MEEQGNPPSDDDKRGPLGPRATGQCFPVFLTAEPCFQTKPSSKPQYMKQEQGSHLAGDPGAPGGGWHLPGVAGALEEAWSHPHTMSWAPAVEGGVRFQEKCKARVPPAVSAARALNAEGRTLGVGSAAADYTGGL